MTIYVDWMQGGTYSAQLDRWNGYAEGWDEGVADLLAFTTTQRALGATMSVDIAAGDAIVQGDDQGLQGNYRVRSDAVVNVALTAAPGSNSRYDIIILQLNDPTAGGAAGNNAIITKVTGTAAATPVVPAVPLSALLLATVGPITPSTSSITNSMIVSNRLLAGRRDFPGALQWSANGTPNGWLLCNGAALSRTTYAKLFATFGTFYGAGNGSTTFNLPTLVDRVPLGASSNYPVGQLGGEINHTLTIAEMPVHSHFGVTGFADLTHNHGATTTGTISSNGLHNHGGEAGFNSLVQSSPASGGTAGITMGGGNYSTGNTYDAGAHSHTWSGSTTVGNNSGNLNHAHAIPLDGGGGGHNNMMPYTAVYGCNIRT